MRSVSSVRTVNTRRSAKQFGPRAPRWDLDHLDNCIGQHRVERGRELSGSVPDEELEPRDVFAEVHHEVAGCCVAQDPSGCHAQHVQIAIADLDCEQDVSPPRSSRVRVAVRAHGSGGFCRTSVGGGAHPQADRDYPLQRLTSRSAIPAP
jgi:hypothetical protein